MKTSVIILVVLVLALFACSCQPQQATITDAQKAAIADSAKTVVQEVFRGAQKLKGSAFFDRYLPDPDVRYVENGVLYPSSLDSLKAFADSFYGMLESLTNSIDSLNVVVLGAEASAVTVTFHFTVKTKVGKQISGQGIFTAAMQFRSGRWLIVQSHESEINFAELMAEIAPPQSKK